MSDSSLIRPDESPDLTKVPRPTRGQKELRSWIDESTTVPWNERFALELTENISHSLHRRILRARRNGGGLRAIAARHRVRGARM